MALEAAKQLTIRATVALAVTYYLSNVLVFEITRRSLTFVYRNLLKVAMNDKFEFDFSDWYDPKKNWFENWAKDFLMGGTAFFFLGRVGHLSQKQGARLIEAMAKGAYRVAKSPIFRDAIDFSFTVGGQFIVVMSMAQISKLLDYQFKRKAGDPLFKSPTYAQLLKDTGHIMILVNGLALMGRRFSTPIEVTEKNRVVMEFLMKH